ncbi:transcription initiation factor TFIID subunit 4-like [Myiozetetes cayanensis]|uniref:transcription initiation factor TFIID subunit 4-like n=1 Tax=Myiozetetes cayanensis TaxID=478635 RepID=UPI00215E6046|nr:transcription initiation factor TFIID subunit 4-like [Myiozetetes cayanensis]
MQGFKCARQREGGHFPVGAAGPSSSPRGRGAPEPRMPRRWPRCRPAAAPPQGTAGQDPAAPGHRPRAPGHRQQQVPALHGGPGVGDEGNPPAAPPLPAGEKWRLPGSASGSDAACPPSVGQHTCLTPHSVAIARWKHFGKTQIPAFRALGMSLGNTSFKRTLPWERFSPNIVLRKQGAWQPSLFGLPSAPAAAGGCLCPSQPPRAVPSSAHPSRSRRTGHSPRKGEFPTSPRTERAPSTASPATPGSRAEPSRAPTRHRSPPAPPAGRPHSSGYCRSRGVLRDHRERAGRGGDEGNRTGFSRSTE